MGYVIAYLLLALVIDLVREIINPESDKRNSVAIHRRLWSDTHFDCRTKVFSVKSAATRRIEGQFSGKPKARLQDVRHGSKGFSWKRVEIFYPVAVHQPSRATNIPKTFLPLQSWVCQKSL